MAQLTVSGRDTAYVWVGRDTGGQPDPAAVLLRRAGALLLGKAEAELVLTHDREWTAASSGSPRRPERSSWRSASSRTAGLVVVAARRAGAVGVDVERVRPLPALAPGPPLVPARRAGLVGRSARGRPDGGLPAAVDRRRRRSVRRSGGGLRDGGLRPVDAAAGAAVAAGARRRAPVGRVTRELGGGLVLAVAAHAEGACRGRGGQRPGHGVTAERSASVERTSLPVVVRGNWSSRCSARGRL